MCYNLHDTSGGERVKLSWADFSADWRWDDHRAWTYLSADW